MRKLSAVILVATVAAAYCAFAGDGQTGKRKGPSILELAYAAGDEDAQENPETQTEPEAEAVAEAGVPMEAAAEESGADAAGDSGLPPLEEILPDEKFIDDVPVRVVTNTVERVVTNTVERVVEVNFAEAYNTDLAERAERLEKALAIEKERRERLERVVPKNLQSKGDRPARITSASTFYDRKEGVVMFDRNVHVDDVNFQLWADKAYVFMQGTNDVRRIVAIGNVAMTNESRRAYGTKASYYKEGGMVVLYGDASRTAELRDESKVDDQTVKGSKIKFWIDSEQVQVIDADIQAPVQGGGGTDDLKKLMNK